jgi:putative methionine-R-sulfoxide reductase with GAF domain
VNIHRVNFMTSNPEYQKILQKIINKEKWWDILSRFIDVLRINLFIIDKYGNVILPPEEGRFGGRLLCDLQLKTGLQPGQLNYLERFEKQDGYLELTNGADLTCYGLPINTLENQTIAYMVIGPLILNKKKENSEYESFARNEGIDPQVLLDQLHEIRIVSNLMIKSIIDLLKTIIRDTVELSLREKDAQKSQEPQQTETTKKMAQEIYSSLRLDELLVTLLDIALKMTQTECGSIMIMDEHKKELIIKVSKGLDASKVSQISIKMGEGISGIAAKNKESFIIKGQKTTDKRMDGLLKRPEIKSALVMPLLTKNRVFGVLNLHTTKEHDLIEGNLENLQYLSKLISSAYSS